MPTSLAGTPSSGPASTTSPGATPSKHTSRDHAVVCIGPACTTAPDTPTRSSASTRLPPSQRIDAVTSTGTSAAAAGTTTSNHVISPGCTSTAPPPLRRRTTSTPAAAARSSSTTANDCADPRTTAATVGSLTTTAGDAQRPDQVEGVESGRAGDDALGAEPDHWCTVTQCAAVDPSKVHQ